MKKKLIGLFVCMLAIAIPGASVIGKISQDANSATMATNKYCNSHQDLFEQSSVMVGWSELAMLLASDGAAYDSFGNSVAIDGEYAIIGAYATNSGQGSAYIFKRSGTSWAQEAKVTASDGVGGDFFGYSVSINGEYAVIGAMQDDSYRGSAYIFKRSGTSWAQEAKVTASDGTAGDYFGYSVSIRGEYIISGAPGYGSDQGSAYVFKRSGTSWTQEAKVTASDGAAGDLFGFSVSIDGEYAVIGAYAANSGQGSAYIFKRSGTSWAQEAKITASDGAAGDDFGYSVAINGEYTIVGAVFDDDLGMNSGSAYVFIRTGTTWTQQAKLHASDGAANDYFSISVSINNGYAVVGADGDDSGRGSAYVFKRSGTSWTQEAKLTATDGAANDHFGSTVSISGYYILTGAYLDDNTYGTNAGSAYVFKKPIPDLDCSGTLSWSKVTPGGTISGEFLIANIGESTSLLSWNIESYPEWGTWNFTPSSGSGLNPEVGAITIGVEVIAPTEKNQQFTGEIKIVNAEDFTDYDTISVSLTTPASYELYVQQFFARFLERFPNAFPILQHLLGY
jgi:hypothetical protein